MWSTTTSRGTRCGSNSASATWTESGGATWFEPRTWSWRTLSEFRVREVLEEKLAVVLGEFGVDKTGDVLDSADAGEDL